MWSIVCTFRGRSGNLVARASTRACYNIDIVRADCNSHANIDSMDTIRKTMQRIHFLAQFLIFLYNIVDCANRKIRLRSVN